MLNIVKNNQILNNKIKNFNEKDDMSPCRHFPSSTREWKNSIFLYNKNNLSLIPNTDLSCINIIKSYFSLFNKITEHNLRTKKLTIRNRKLSSNRIYISNGEFKHTNNKVTINLFLFNRQAINYSLILKEIKTRLMDLDMKMFTTSSERLNFIENESLSGLKNSKLFLIRKLKNNDNNPRINYYINTYLENFSRKLIRNEEKVTLLYNFYKQIITINKLKHSYQYLQYLKQHIYKLYNKQVEFNFINLKRYYLNSDILTDVITKKVTTDRKRVKFFLTKFKNKITIKKKDAILKDLFAKKLVSKKISHTIKINKIKKSLLETVVNLLKYKKVTGFRVEAKGRLTKRYTASRSLYKMDYKGNLINIDSSLKRKSSVLLKGNLNSNIQYSKSVSKTRIGSFGIKGWINGY